MKRIAVVAAIVATVSVITMWAQAPKKAYVLVQVEVTNAQQYGEYTATLEGTPARSRVVVVEFPSFERAQEFYNSQEYQAARKVRTGAATAQFVLVEGL